MAARWYTWALVVTSSGIVDTGILAMTYETSGYVHGASRDESSAAVGSSTASAATIAVMESQQASAAQREHVLQAQLADLLDRWNRSAAQAETGTDDDHGASRQQ